MKIFIKFMEEKLMKKRKDLEFWSGLLSAFIIMSLVYVFISILLIGCSAK